MEFRIPHNIVCNTTVSKPAQATVVVCMKVVCLHISEACLDNLYVYKQSTTEDVFVMQREPGGGLMLM